MLISEMHLNISGFHLPFTYVPADSNCACHSRLCLGLPEPPREGGG